MSNWNKRIRAAREAQKMTREMVVQKMQQFLPESEKAVTTRSLMSWEAGEREPRVTVGVALAKALGFEDVAVLYLDSEPKLNQAGQQRLGEYRSMLLHTAEFTEKPEPTLRLLPWICVGQTLKEFEDVAFALEIGQVSEPFMSPVGYHIVKMTDRKQLEPYDSLRANIITFIEKRNLRDMIAQKKLAEMVKASDGKLTAEDVMDQKADSIAKVDEAMKYLIQEYHDGDTRLTSDWGQYNSSDRQAVFYYNVKLKNSNSLTEGDTLYYDTKTSKAHVVGPSKITMKDWAALLM